MNPARGALQVAVIASLAAPALAQFAESEPNDSKAAANYIGPLLSGSALSGASILSTGAGLDYFKLTTGVLGTPAITRHSLALVSNGGQPPHSASLRGLNQTAGVIGTLDTTFQAGVLSGGVRTNVWYGFGRGESVYYRVNGASTNTAGYSATLTDTTITPIAVAGCFGAGPITISSVGQGYSTDTDLWLYDSTFTAIVDAGNDDEPAPGTTLQSKLTRTLAAGTYYVAISTYQFANNLASPVDDRFRGGIVLDFADAAADNSVQTAVNCSFTISDGVNTVQVAAIKNAAFDVVWATFTVNMFCGPPPNDNCANAALLTTSSVMSSTANATHDGSSSCDATGRDLWWKYTAPSAGTLFLDTCGSAIDTVVSVFNACAGTQLACNDTCAGAPCAGPSACTSLALAAGASVWIRVSDKGIGAGGVVVLNDTFVGPPPANDACWSATVISGSGAFAFDNRFATPTAQDALTTCAPINRDVWYQWTSDAGGSVTVSTCGVSPAFDSILSIYGAPCPTLAGSQLACNDDFAACGELSSLTFTAADCETYYIRIGSFQTTGTSGSGMFTIAAPPPLDTDGDSVTDCFDGCPFDPAKVTPGVCGCGIADIDSDGDGTPNCFDGCPNDPGKTAPGICGCGVADTDSDGDGTPNCHDGCPSDPNKIAPGACGCGVADLDSDGDGTANCIDGCPNDPGKIAAGQCGCGTADTDSDSDGIADCIDNCDPLPNPSQADCDADGIGDVCELANGTATDTDANGIPDNCQLGVWFNYCTSGTSTHNCNASMSASGIPSASATSGFTLTTSNLEGQKSCVMFYGITGVVASPWGSGSSVLCVKSPKQRFPSGSAGGALNTCTGSRAIDFLAFIAANPLAVGAPFAAGDVVWAQTWYRDPPAPKTTNLSNALQFTFAP